MSACQTARFTVLYAVNRAVLLVRPDTLTDDKAAADDKALFVDSTSKHTQLLRGTHISDEHIFEEKTCSGNS